MKQWVLVILISFTTLNIFSQDISTLLTDAQTLINNKDEETALKKYQAVLQKDAKNYEALWNISFLYTKIGNRMGKGDSQNDYFNKAKDYAQQALDVNPNDAMSNYMMAVAMGRIALIANAHDKVAAARDIKKYADLTVKYDPNFGGGWHVLALWNHKMANLNWMEKAVADLLYGGIPDGANDTDAEKDFKQAIRLRHDYMLYYYDFAVFYDDKDKEDLALYMLNKCLELKDETEDDTNTRKDCLELIKEIQD